MKDCGVSGGHSGITDLLAALHAPDKQVRARAAADLAAMGSPVVDPLVATLRDPRWEVRYRAAEALGQIRDPRVCRALAGALAGSIFTLLIFSFQLLALA